MIGDARRQRARGWPRPLWVLVIVLGVLLPGDASAERVLTEYRISADLRVQPAQFEIRLTYRDPDLIPESALDELDPSARLLQELSENTPLTPEAIAARELLQSARRTEALHGSDWQRERDRRQAQEGFKFVGEQRVTKFTAKTPEGEKLDTDISRRFDQIRLEYSIPQSESGESTVVLRFRQPTDVATQRGFDTFSTRVDWADRWKLAVEHMEVELLFSLGASPPTSWDCERQDDAVRCHRKEGALFPVAVFHEAPSLSATVWFPLASLVVFAVAGVWGLRVWRQDKGEAPSAPPGTSWTPPEPLDVEPQLSDLDRNALFVRLAVLAGLFGLAVLVMAGYAEGRSWISFGGQLVVLLFAATGALVFALRPSTETGIAALVFGWILALVLGVLLLDFGWAAALFAGSIFVLLIPLMISAGGGGFGGSFASSCSSCSSCGSSCGGGCGGGCGGCGG